MKDYRKMTDKSGQDGEELMQWYCKTYDFTYSEPSNEDKINTGVDCFLNGVPTDVKNTLKIMIGNYKLSNSTRSYKDRFLLRMPFRDNCKAIDYCILDIDPINKAQKIIYHGRIDTYLSDNYFIDSKALTEAYKLLKTYDLHSYSYMNCSSINQLFFKLKTELKQFLRDDVIIKYMDESLLKKMPYAEELQFYIIKINDYKITENRKKWWSEKLKKKKA